MGPVFLDRDIWLQHHHHTARGVPRRILVRPSVTEIVLRKYLAGVAPAGFSDFLMLFLHTLSAHGVIVKFAVSTWVVAASAAPR